MNKEIQEGDIVKIISKDENFVSIYGKEFVIEMVLEPEDGIGCYIIMVNDKAWSVQDYEVESTGKFGEIEGMSDMRLSVSVDSEGQGTITNIAIDDNAEE